MSAPISLTNRSPSVLRSHGAKVLAPALALLCLVAQCLAQGTMTFTFEGQPPGTQRQVGVYQAAGMQFDPIPMGALYLSGSGVPGYPDNGTGYLFAPDNGLRFYYPSYSAPPFSLVSFDAARYDGAAPPTLKVIGYRGMASPVTNYFTVVSGASDFQTFYPDARFVNLYQVDIYASFSLDNLVIGGVPEPSADALVLLGAACAFGRSRIKRRRP
jgi:hypothetical protein